MTPRKRTAPRAQAKPKTALGNGIDPDTVDLVVAASPAVDDGARLVPFKLDDDPNTVLVATRPKMAILMRLMAVLGIEAKTEKQKIEQIGALASMIPQLFDEATREYLNERWNKPADEDTLDLECLGPILQSVSSRWYAGGPTGGGPRGSRNSPSRSGKKSTVRRPSKGSTSRS